MKLPLLIEAADSSILENVRDGIDEHTLDILDASPHGKRVLAYLAECYLAGLECSVLTAVAVCEAGAAVRPAALQHDPLLLDDRDFALLDAFAA